MPKIERGQVWNYLGDTCQWLYFENEQLWINRLNEVGDVDWLSADLSVEPKEVETLIPNSEENWIDETLVAYEEKTQAKGSENGPQTI